MRWVLLVATLPFAVQAHAGECGMDQIAGFIADEQDARAKAEPPGEPKDDYHLCIWWTLPDVPKQQPKLEQRLLKACETILTKRQNDMLCTEIAATFGKDTLGKTDIVAALDAWPFRGIDEHTIDFMALTNAPRGSRRASERADVGPSRRGRRDSKPPVPRQNSAARRGRRVAPRAPAPTRAALACACSTPDCSAARSAPSRRDTSELPQR